jgi:integrase
MAKMKPPHVSEQPVDIYQPAELRALLDGCKGIGFEARRNMAIVRSFLSTGARLAEITRVLLTDLDLDEQTMTVTGKGGRRRVVSLTPVAVKDLDRYLRARDRHKDAALPWLWLGKRGPLRESGIEQMLRKLGERVGVENAYPHRFRHTFGHMWMDNEDGKESDLMRIAGWRSRDMARYGASAADERARKAQLRMRIGDDL